MAILVIFDGATLLRKQVFKRGRRAPAGQIDEYQPEGSPPEAELGAAPQPVSDTAGEPRPDREASESLAPPEAGAESSVVTPDEEPTETLPSQAAEMLSSERPDQDSSETPPPGDTLDGSLGDSRGQSQSEDPDSPGPDDEEAAQHG
jgi:hypothetical protein